mmetsp:Transcript_94200/g.266603  ORF Transcript_94200/g.266603 Transcript_94200/m.266603 type:complete len:229 (-) Transcript_94200:1503-2189(-)
MTVSLIVLKLPAFSLRYMTPFFATVAHPWAPSLNALTSTRVALSLCSQNGPRSTSRTSIGWSCRRVLPSVAALSDSVACPLTTRTYVRTKRRKLSLDIVVSPSAQRLAKSRASISEDSSTVSSLLPASSPSPAGFSAEGSASSIGRAFRTFSAASKYAKNSFSSSVPLLSVSRTPNISSESSFFTCWSYRSTLTAAERTPSSSPATFFCASSRNCAAIFSALATFASS